MRLLAAKSAAAETPFPSRTTIEGTLFHSKENKSAVSAFARPEAPLAALPIVEPLASTYPEGALVQYPVMRVPVATAEFRALIAALIAARAEAELAPLEMVERGIVNQSSLLCRPKSWSHPKSQP